MSRDERAATAVAYQSYELEPARQAVLRAALEEPAPPRRGHVGQSEALRAARVDALASRPRTLAALRALVASCTAECLYSDDDVHARLAFEEAAGELRLAERYTVGGGVVALELAQDAARFYPVDDEGCVIDRPDIAAREMRRRVRALDEAMRGAA